MVAFLKCFKTSSLRGIKYKASIGLLSRRLLVRFLRVRFRGVVRVYYYTFYLGDVMYVLDFTTSRWPYFKILFIDFNLSFILGILIPLQVNINTERDEKTKTNVESMQLCYITTSLRH